MYSSPRSRHLIAFTFAALFFSSGCLAPKNVRSLGSAIALQGKNVSTSALTVYDDLGKQQDVDKSQQDFIKVVTSPNPASPNLPDSKSRPFTKQLQPRVEAYQALLKTYSTFQILTDKSFGDQAKTAADSLFTSYNSIKAVPDLPGIVTSALPSVLGLITEAKQARDIRKHNRALTELCKLYRELWEQDLPIWRDYLNRVYGDFSNGLSSLDASRFDEQRLAEVVNEPFSKEINVGLYKIHQRNAAFEKRDTILAKLQLVNQALGQLESAHIELVKAKPSLPDALAALDTIQSLLSTLTVAHQ